MSFTFADSDRLADLRQQREENETDAIEFWEREQQRQQYPHTLGGSIAQDEWEAKQIYDKRISKDYSPSLKNKIRGLPPIGFNTSGNYEPMAIADKTIQGAQDTVFKNSVFCSTDI